MDTAPRGRDGGGGGVSPALGFVTAGASVQLITLGITTALWFGLHQTGVKFARDVTLGGVVFTAVVLLAASPVLTTVQRNRLRAWLGVDIPPVTARRSAVAKHINAVFAKLDLAPGNGDRRVLAVLRFLAH